MSLLALQNVSKHHRRGRVERLVLDGVSLELDTGELVAVWGLRRSGRTTLLRIAAGMERPDIGLARFDGQNLAHRRDRVLGRDIGYVQLHFSAGEGASVLDQIGGGLLAGRVALATARRHALQMLAEVDAVSCASLSPRDLNSAEAVRAAIARALITRPRLLIVDEPTSGVDIVDRDSILGLLRRIANGGVTVLMSTGDGAALAGSDRVFTIDHGKLRGGVADPKAPVVPLRRPTRLSADADHRHAG
jgi:putative ABC transport system ATP-binding protein